MKLKLLYLFIAISSISFGQTLEKSYRTPGDPDSAIFFFTTELDLFYLTLDLISNKVFIYNSSHVLYKTISLNMPTGYNLENIYLSTDKLFNSDAKIEILAGTRGNSQFKLLLFNEDGNNIFDFGGKSKIKIFKDKKNNFKLMTFTFNSPNTHYDIYSLSGTLTTSQEELLSEKIISSFPNPSINSINITNPLYNNEIERLKIYDINGRLVLEKEVIGNGENIELNISNLSNGVYNYRIGGFSNKFIKK